MGEMGKNASNAMGEPSNAVNQTASEIGKNASAGGQSLLNQTGEVAKKIVVEQQQLIGNISGEIKKGIGEK